MALLVFLFLPMVTKSHKAEGRSVFYLVFFLLIATISVWYNNSVFSILASRLLFISVAFRISMQYRIDEFMAAFESFLYLVAVCSIGTFIVSYIWPGIFSLFYQLNNEVGFSYSSYFLGSIQLEELSNPLRRMNGVFWEPGAFAIYLCIGILFHLFCRENIEKKKLVVYITALLITFSTTGIIGFAFILMTYVFFNKNAKTSSKALVGVLGMVIVAVLASGAFDIVSDLLFSKVTDNANTTIVRVASLVCGAQIGLDHPILGVGGQSSDYMSIYSVKAGFIETKMLTNTLTAQFANYGIVYGTLFTVGTFSFFKKIGNGGMFSFMLFLALMLLYMGESFFSFLPFLFVFYGIKKEKFQKYK